jgi:hypothetical protein
MFSYALRGEAVKISSRAPVSQIFRLFVDPLNGFGEIQAGGKIEVLIRLDRNESIGLFCAKQRTPAFALSDTFDHRDARDMANKR